ncbi:alpha/beta fold hydrolase [Nonomuraea typhae]|uniref:alpha/beta fold hydrolase n=1 Tax=Nonomuraea typhae TaxID=2603600 RepID=UPI0012F9F411|nr:alpha/beta fold hydrolase [Nonomuraea typhae]
MSAEVGTRVSDTGPRTAVLLLYGGAPGTSGYTGGPEVWDPVSGAIAAAGHQVIAWDGAGGGRDAEPAVLATLDGLGVSAFHVVGHGEAGLLALQLARSVPGRVLSCSVIAGHEAAPTGDSPVNLRLAHPPADPRRAQAWHLERLSYTPHHVDDALLDAHAARAATDPPAQPPADLLAAKDALYAYARDHGYRVPIMLVWGSHDPLSEVERGVALLDLLATTTAPLSLHVVNRAGHFVFRERPREVLRLLLPFLARSERSQEVR